jgi:hypothetical protein
MFNFAQTRLRKENTVRGVVECAIIYTLTVILVLVGAAASAIVVIAMWDAGAPAWRRWRQRQRAS